MLAAIRDDNPVLYVEPMSLAHGPREEVPAGEILVPIGKARVAREGTDLTIVTIGSTVPVALRAAAMLGRGGHRRRGGGPALARPAGRRHHRRLGAEDRAAW